MTPFRRLALFAAGALVAGIIAAVWAFVSWPVALCALLGGVTLAVVSTVDLEPKQEEPEPEGERVGRAQFRPRQRPISVVDRDEIEKRATASRERPE